MNTNINEIEKQLREKTRKYVENYLYQISQSLKSKEGREIFDSGVPLLYYKNIKENQEPQYISIKMRDVFSDSTLKAKIVSACINSLARKEILDFVKKVENPDYKAQLNSSSEQDELIRKALRSHVDKIQKQLDDKKQMKKYLTEFLSKYVYKGSDAKQKIERELIALNREIEALQLTAIKDEDLIF